MKPCSRRGRAEADVCLAGSQQLSDSELCATSIHTPFGPGKWDSESLGGQGQLIRREALNVQRGQAILLGLSSCWGRPVPGPNQISLETSNGLGEPGQTPEAGLHPDLTVIPRWAPTETAELCLPLPSLLPQLTPSCWESHIHPTFSVCWTCTRCLVHQRLPPCGRYYGGYFVGVFENVVLWQMHG